VPSSTSSTVGGNRIDTTWPSLPRAKVVRHGPTDKKMIALTFDDNYQKPNAFATLKVLEEYKVPATFFVIGHYADTGPALARAIAKGGFEVGDHTRDHWNCATLSKPSLRNQIGNGTDRYHALTGAPTVPLFRPPGGFFDQKTEEVAGEKGFKYVVMWDIDTKDWQGHTAAQITENVMGNVHNGAIVLMHVAAPHTAEALPNIINRLRKAGYELVTVSKLLGM
jgi:peptidoglycan/xylan/chitin deacetylase (PgdA/CDA1 family)